MDLLSDADRTKIRAALHDVTDTFFKTPVQYYSSIKASLDRFQEDRTDVRAVEPINLLGLIKHPDDSGEWGKELPIGVLAEADIKVTLNYEDLQALGLTIDEYKTVVFKIGEDWFTAKGLQYKVLFVGYNGPLDKQPVIVKLWGQIRTNGSEV